MSNAQAVQQHSPYYFALPYIDDARRLPPVIPADLQQKVEGAPELLCWFGSQLGENLTHFRKATRRVDEAKGLLFNDCRPEPAVRYFFKIRNGWDIHAADAALGAYSYIGPSGLEAPDRAAAITMALWAWFEPPQRLGR